MSELSMKKITRGSARNLRDLCKRSIVTNQNEKNAQIDKQYYKSYDRPSIHREMIQDKARTLAYKQAICENKHLFKNKVVLDVGCGTGILSLFAAKAGAALVIGVDCSNIIDDALEVTENQGPDISNKIVLLKTKIEDITELPKGVEKVDIIISEWMGYSLLFESMLDTVLFARDKWLKKGGLLFPDKASLYVTGIAARKERDMRYNFWQNLHGFNFSVMRKQLAKLALVKHVDALRRRTDDFLLKKFNLYKVRKENLNFTVPFDLKANFEDEIQAFVTFFTVEFTHCHTPVIINTSMDSPRTHWMQTVLFLPDDIYVKANEVIKGEFTLKQNRDNKRALDFEINFNFKGYYMNYNEKLFFTL